MGRKLKKKKKKKLATPIEVDTFLVFDFFF